MTGRRRGARTALWAVRLMLAGTVIAPAVEMPNLTGTWQLNKDASDDAQKAMKEARAAESRGGGGGGGMGGGGGGMGGRGGHGGGGGGGMGGGRGSHGDSGSQSSSGNGDWFGALDTLVIQHGEPSLTITDAAGRVHALYTDGRKTEEERSHGGTTSVTATWKDGHLEVVSRPENGSKITETYSVTADRSQLTVVTKIEGSRGPAFTIRRVYDAVQPGAPKPTPPARRAPSTTPGPAEDDGVDQSV
jgi:hypothetical protein